MDFTFSPFPTRIMPATAPAEPRVSVCIAAYNGSRHITEQIESILDQLRAADEIVVVDDHSTDETADVIAAIDDPRIRLVRAESNRGYVRTFERAIGLATGDVIFLSDQDDVWLPGRRDAMVRALEDAELVVTNFSYFGGEVPRLQRRRLSAAHSAQRLRNILWIWVGVRLYYGCCMAFRAEMTERLLPFPSYLTETHDQWIGFVGNADGSVRHLEIDSVARRIHDGNATAKTTRPMLTIIRARVMTARSAIEALRRSRQKSRRSD